MGKALTKPVVVAFAALSLVVGSCGSDQGTANSPAPATTPHATTGNTTSPALSTVSSTAMSTSVGPVEATSGSTVTEGSATMGSGPIDPGLKPYIDIAVADLAQRLGIGADKIEVDSATLEQWPDSSLGCPEKGMQYAQVLTDGALIVLTSGAKTYKYHAGGSRPPFYCANSKATPSG